MAAQIKTGALEIGGGFWESEADASYRSLREMVLNRGVPAPRMSF
jgi:hypothetical protein